MWKYAYVTYWAPSFGNLLIEKMAKIFQSRSDTKKVCQNMKISALKIMVNSPFQFTSILSYQREYIHSCNVTSYYSIATFEYIFLSLFDRIEAHEHLYLIPDSPFSVTLQNNLPSTVAQQCRYAKVNRNYKNTTAYTGYYWSYTNYYEIRKS